MHTVNTFLEIARQDSHRSIWQCVDLPAMKFGHLVDSSFILFDGKKYPKRSSKNSKIDDTLAALCHFAYVSSDDANKVAYSDIHCTYSLFNTSYFLLTHAVSRRHLQCGRCVHRIFCHTHVGFHLSTMLISPNFSFKIDLLKIALCAFKCRRQR